MDLLMSPVQKMLKDYETAKRDPRTKDWLLIGNSPYNVWLITVLYVAFVYLGPVFMKNRKPLQVQGLLVAYNMGLVVLSAYMVIEIFLSSYAANYGLLCAEYDVETVDVNDPKELRVAKVLWWYFFSKAIELMDTVLMVLRKKNDQVTFLHWFHHISMLNIWWWVMVFAPGGLSSHGSSLNCLVHVVMYLYYGLSAIPSVRKHLWWKKYITKFQLIQFCITLSHTLNSFRNQCHYPVWGKYLLTGYMVLMLILFMNFYVHAYFFKKRIHIKTDHLSNGATNGHAKGGDGHIKNGYISLKAD
ncbi:elongation of very long chain fatty acids protein 2-like [Lingula anatina]|uniref:Elongation of very long chain fatty acids protein n=1 Tax=Lingula anatina TaxID=7574 RepID=A0A1S3JRY3_LINAN|nr:elongation of very long chain fatty acids protein 2-like [Lingula anatina]XP_013413183.1 elongation of very long chain fatty acids protein 2-like [Lingula anatina]XP_013413184.1 elongation of very long chain fatty acids protein 2-like [Lingula anatina]XP_013413185.1 elongation of very long chain fatty acids protein 2-like [Lingula anatina]|eukprot:XP_013413182.1 elongation of very long chain fatty acids protein 2-like [Lingula anatina]